MYIFVLKQLSALTLIVWRNDRESMSRSAEPENKDLLKVQSVKVRLAPAGVDVQTLRC